MRIFLVGALLAFGAPAHAADAPRLEVNLTPVVNSSRQKIDAVNVTVRIEGASATAGTALFKMPLVIYNVETVAKSLQQLSASDARGPLTLSVRDDPEGGQEFNRQWFSNRATEGALTVHYSAPISGQLA